MTRLLAHLRGRMVTVARQRDLLASGEGARAIVELATGHLSPERAARVTPSVRDGVAPRRASPQPGHRQRPQAPPHRPPGSPMVVAGVF